MNAEQDRFGVKTLCARHGVTRAGYYSFRRREPSLHARQDERLLKRIRAVFEASEGTNGSPRIHASLQREICDNALIESFFHSLKADVIHGRTFDDDRSLNHVVRCYVRRYNRTRLHSSLGYRSPIHYEQSAA